MKIPVFPIDACKTIYYEYKQDWMAPQTSEDRYMNIIEVYRIRKLYNNMKFN